MAQKTNQSSPVPSAEQNTSPRPCSNGCGFFGVPNTNGMCSVCFKEHQSRLKNNNTTTTTTAGRVSPPIGGATGGSVSSSEAVVVNKVLGGGVETASTLSQQMTEMSLASLEDGKQQLGLKSRVSPPPLGGAIGGGGGGGGVSVSSETAAKTSEDSSDSSSVSSKDQPTVCSAVHPVVNKTPTTFATATLSSSDSSRDPAGGPPAKPKTNRCFLASCRKKVGLAGFDCRCGNQFCGRHRYSDQHDCPYDYKAEAAAKIRKENPAVVADKIRRI